MPVPGFIRALDLDQVVGGVGKGAPAISWYRLRVPVIEGEPTSPLARVAAAADFTSGTANFLPINRWSSINADVTLNVLREPVGEWIAVDAVAHVAGDGIGHSRASSYDIEGYVGSGATTQIVEEVAAPFAELADARGRVVVEQGLGRVRVSSTSPPESPGGTAPGCSPTPAPTS